MISASDILSLTPYWYGDGQKRLDPLDFEEAAVEIRQLAMPIRWSAGNLDALRILAYAVYAGGLNESEIRERLNGSDARLAADVRALSLQADDAHGAETDRIIDMTLAGHEGPGIHATGVDQGWVQAALEMIVDVRPRVIPLLLKGDFSSRFVLRWSLLRWSPSTDRQRYANVLAKLDDSRSVRAAASFLASIAREYVMSGGRKPIFKGSDSGVLIVAGLVLTQLTWISKRPNIRNNEALKKRCAALMQRLGAVVTSKIKSRKDLDSLVRVRKGDEAALFAVLLGESATGKIQVEMEKRADVLLDDYFRELKSTDVRSEDDALPYLSEIVLPTLTKIWRNIGADSSRFGDFRQRLHFDEYAYQFAYAHYITDRRRAMCLAAVAGEVGAARGENDPLLQDAQELARTLRALPSVQARVFSDDTLDHLRNLGVDLPVA